MSPKLSNLKSCNCIKKKWETLKKVEVYLVKRKFKYLKNRCGVFGFKKKTIP